MKIRITTFLFLSFFYVSSVIAQEEHTSTPPKKDVILSTSLTGNAYYGDMNYTSNLLNSQSSTYFSMNPGVNLSIYTDHPRFLRPAFSAGYGRIVGQNSSFQPAYYTNSFGDQELVQPTRYVRTDYVYGDMGLRFTPIRKTAQFDPYLYAGVGGFFFRPVKLSANGDPLPQGGLKSNSYSAAAISFPISAGMDINLGRKISLNVGAGMRLPMTDFIDNTGGNYGGVYNVQEGNDKIVTLNVGANFRIFDSEKLPKIFRFPELFFSEQKKSASEPEDTLILASALDLSEHPEFLAPKNWQSHDASAKKMKMLVGELVLTSECDSLSRVYEERILNLTNENLQLRGEYSKLAQETNKLREENLNYALKEKVTNEKLAELASKNGDKNYSGVAVNRTIDSLMNIVNKLKTQSVEGMAISHENNTEKDSLLNVIAQKEQMIADLQEGAKSIPVPTPNPVRKAGDGTEEIELIAVYERQLDSLKGEMRRLERKYYEASNDADIANAQKETLKERLKANESKILASSSPNKTEDLDVLMYEKKIDSLNLENERNYAELSRLRTENDAIKREKYKQIAPDTDCRERVDSMNILLASKQEEFSVLQNQYNTLVKEKRTVEPAPQKDLAAIQKQVADIMGKVAQLQQERDEARSENERLVSENSKLKKDQQALVTQNANQAILILVQRAQQRVDSMNAYFSALQKNIDGYERKINDLRAQNDSLQTELEHLNRMVDKDKVVEDVRVADLENQLKEANRKVTELDEKLAVAKTARVAPENFEEDVKDLRNKLSIAEAQIAEVEAKNQNLIEENQLLKTKSKPSLMTPPSSENDKERIAELENQVKTLQSAKEGLIAQIEQLEEKSDKLAEENIVLKNQQGGGDSEAIATLTAKIQSLQEEVDGLNQEKLAWTSKTASTPTPAVAESDEEALKQKIKELQAENEELIVQMSRLEMDNKQLAGENDLLRKNPTKNTLMAELENLRPKVETLEKQNNELEQNLITAKEENARLAARTVATPETTAGDENAQALAEAKDKIKSLEKDNEVLKQQVVILSEDKSEVAEVPVLMQKIADLEEKLAAKSVNISAEKLQAENEDLKKQKDDLIAQTESMETTLKANEITIANLKELNVKNQPVSASADVAEAQTQIKTLNEQLAQKNARIEELEANSNKPSSSDEYDQLLINYNRVLADKAVLEEKWRLSQDGEKPEVLMMSLMEENTKLKAEKDSIVSRIKEAVVNSGLTTQKVEELANLYKDNETLKGKVVSLEAEVADLKAKTATENPDESLQSKIASLEMANKTLKQQLEANTAEVSTLLKEKDEWQLKANQLAAADSVAKLNARVGVTVVKDPETETLRVENEALKKQIAESGDAEQSLKALQERLNASEDEIAKKDNEIAQWKAVAEGAKTDDNGAALAKLEKENAVLAEENRSLKDEIAKMQPQPSDNAEFEKQIAALKTVISDKEAEIEELKAAPKEDNGLADLKAEMNNLKNENIRLNEENEYLKGELANVKVSTPNIELQSKIDALKAEVERKDQEIASLRSSNPGTNGVAEALSTKDDALNSRFNEQEMREKKLNQRENYISLKEEEIHRNEKKYEYLNAKEIELRLSEQRISGFYSRPENMLIDGSPCQYVTAFLEKEEVMNKIDDYFLGMGYNYRLENGKIVYSNIVIPEISNKPMNVAFYMRIADTGKRTLQGVFRFANGTYVNEDKFPAETIKAIKLLQKMAQ